MENETRSKLPEGSIEDVDPFFSLLSRNSGPMSNPSTVQPTTATAAPTSMYPRETLHNTQEFCTPQKTYFCSERLTSLSQNPHPQPSPSKKILPQPEYFSPEPHLSPYPDSKPIQNLHSGTYQSSLPPPQGDIFSQMTKGNVPVTSHAQTSQEQGIRTTKTSAQSSHANYPPSAPITTTYTDNQQCVSIRDAITPTLPTHTSQNLAGSAPPARATPTPYATGLPSNPATHPLPAQPFKTHKSVHAAPVHSPTAPDALLPTLDREVASEAASEVAFEVASEVASASIFSVIGKLDLTRVGDVFGLEESVVWRWFQLAAGEGTSLLTSALAVAFLTRSGLPTPTLAWVWEHAAVRRERTLSPLEFSLALRLVALAQHALEARQPINTDLAQRAYSLQAPPCPPPRFKDIHANPVRPTTGHSASIHPTPTHPTSTHPTPNHPSPNQPIPTHPTPTHPTPTHPTPRNPAPMHPSSSGASLGEDSTCSSSLTTTPPRPPRPPHNSTSATGRRNAPATPFNTPTPTQPPVSTLPLHSVTVTPIQTPPSGAAAAAADQRQGLESVDPRSFSANHTPPRGPPPPSFPPPRPSQHHGHGHGRHLQGSLQEGMAACSVSSSLPSSEGGSTLGGDPLGLPAGPDMKGRRWSWEDEMSEQHLQLEGVGVVGSTPARQSASSSVPSRIQAVPTVAAIPVSTDRDLPDGSSRVLPPVPLEVRPVPLSRSASSSSSLPFSSLACLPHTLIASSPASASLRCWDTTALLGTHPHPHPHPHSHIGTHHYHHHHHHHHTDASNAHHKGGRGDQAAAAAHVELDAAPSYHLSSSRMVVEGAGVGQVNCCHTHPASGTLWTGHSEGYLMVRAAGRGARPQGTAAGGGGQSPVSLWLGPESDVGGGGEVSWAAFKAAVTAVVVLPSGEVWVGSQGGNLRVYLPPTRSHQAPRGMPLSQSSGFLVPERARQDLDSIPMSSSAPMRDPFSPPPAIPPPSLAASSATSTASTSSFHSSASRSNSVSNIRSSLNSTLNSTLTSTLSQASNLTSTFTSSLGARGRVASVKDTPEKETPNPASSSGSFTGNSPLWSPEVLEVTRGARLGGRVHSEVRHLAVAGWGSHVWSAGGASMCVWDARSRTCVKTFQEEQEDQQDCAQVEGEFTRQGSQVEGHSAGAAKEGVKTREGTQDWKGSGAVLLSKLGSRMGKASKAVLGQVHSWGSDMMDLRPHIRGFAVPQDQSVWVAFADGRIERYTAEGVKLGEWCVCGEDLKLGPKSRVRSVAAVGSRVWLGGEQGELWVLQTSKEGSFQSVARWEAHSSAVLAVAWDAHSAPGRVFTLAQDGDIRGWPVQVGSEGQFVNMAVARALQCDLASYVSLERVRILAATWNVNESRPPRSSFVTWLGELAPKADIVAVGLQEMEMGGGSLLSTGAKEIFSKESLEKGNENANWWCEEMLRSLQPPSSGNRGGAGVNDPLGSDPSSSSSSSSAIPSNRETLLSSSSSSSFGEQWVRVGMRQMSGMLVAVFARSGLRPWMGAAQTTSVATGLLGVGGNKGAVAIRFLLFRRMVCVICSHFAAHQNGVLRRNADYDHISSSLKFDGPCGASAPPPWRVPPLLPSATSTSATSNTSGISTAPSGGSFTAQAPHMHASSSEPKLSALTGLDALFPKPGGGPMVQPTSHSVSSEAQQQQQQQQQHCAQSLTPQHHHHHQGIGSADLLIWLGDFNYRIDLSYDQVIRSLWSGNTDELWRADQLRKERSKQSVFQGMSEARPTFPPTYKFDKGTSQYDTSEKRRVPSWTDRVLFRTRTPSSQGEIGLEGEAGCGEEDVVKWSQGGEVPTSAGLHSYECCGSIVDSDHKPVRALLHVRILKEDATNRRRLHLLAEDSAHRSKLVDVGPQ